MGNNRLSKQLSTSLSDKTYDVDSPYQARQREARIKNSAPFLGRNYFDRVEAEQRGDGRTHDTAPTPQHIKDTRKTTIHSTQFSAECNQQLYVELEDGSLSLVKYPEPTSEAGIVFSNTANQITKMSERWAQEEAAKELDELKWDLFRQGQMAVADWGVVKLWEKDLAIRQIKSKMQHKLQNGHVFFVQKQPFFGTPSHCAYTFCPARNSRTPLGSYRLSFEPRKNQNLPAIPVDVVSGQSMRGHGTHGAQWYCLTCVEDIWNGVGLITAGKLVEIAVDVDRENGRIIDRDESPSSSKPNNRGIGKAIHGSNNGDTPEAAGATASMRYIEMRDAADQAESPKRKGKPTSAVKVSGRRTTSRVGKTKTKKGRIGKAPGVGLPLTVSAPARGSTVNTASNIDTPAPRNKYPRPPGLPAPKRPYATLSQSIYSFMLAETREHMHDYFVLPTAQHAALLKWKSTILRSTESKIKRNVEFRKKTGAFFRDAEDEDDNTGHDPIYWLEYEGGRGQLVGLVDPGGLVLELTTAECRDEKLSEVFRIVDDRVQAEWAKLGYTPEPPSHRKIVVLKFNYQKLFPHASPLLSQHEQQDESEDDTNSDHSEDLPSSSSSEEEP
ncbi:MAG: hypothetical protein M1839_007342 [Geoglossum umbratile]|nr:MAG: hypothetical protein M1839_007342 [Geoglossum umbratile]